MTTLPCEYPIPFSDTPILSKSATLIPVAPKSFEKFEWLKNIYYIYIINHTSFFRYPSPTGVRLRSRIRSRPGACTSPQAVGRARKKRKKPRNPETLGAKHHKPRPAGILTAPGPPGHNRVNDKPRIITTIRDLFQSYSVRHAQIILNVRTARTPSAGPAQVRERRTAGKGKR